MHNHQGAICGNTNSTVKAAVRATIITSFVFSLNYQLGNCEENQGNSAWSYITEAKGETVEITTGRFIYHSPTLENKEQVKGALLEPGSKVLVTSGPLRTKNQYWIGVKKGGWVAIDTNIQEIKPNVWSLEDSETFYTLQVEPIADSKEAVRVFAKPGLILQSSSTLKQGGKTWVYFVIEGYLIASNGENDFVTTPKLQKRPVEVAIISPPQDNMVDIPTEPSEDADFFSVQGEQARFHFHNNQIATVSYDEILENNGVTILNDTQWGINHPSITIGADYSDRPELFLLAQKLVDEAAAAQTAETGLTVTGQVKVSGSNELQLNDRNYSPSGIDAMHSTIRLNLYSVNYIENVQYWNSKAGLAKQWELVETFGESVGGDIYLFQPNEGLTRYDDPEIEIDTPIEKGGIRTDFSHYHINKNVFQNPGALNAIFTGTHPASITKDPPTFMGVTPNTHPQAWALIVSLIEQNQLAAAKQLAWQCLAKSASGEGFYSEVPLIHEILVSIHHHRGSRGAQEVLALFLERDHGALSELIKAFEKRILHSQGWEQQWVEARQTQEWQYHVPRLGVAATEREKFRKGLEMRWSTEAIYLSRGSKQPGKLKRD